MKKIELTILIVFLSLLNVSAQESCMNTENLKKLDSLWEKALLQINLDFIETTVSENFIWVHNHAVRTDSKKSLLESGQKFVENNTRNSKSRIQKDVRVIISGTTGVVTGFTNVERSDGNTRTTFNFMRTYAEIDGKCYLVANHTMAIPEKEMN